MRDAAAASGQDPRQFVVGWVFSVATMPDDEMRVLLKSHYPQLAEAMREREEHETATGHSFVFRWMFLRGASDERNG